MLTTASITFSAMSAIPSGPRAKAGADSMLAAPIVAAAARWRRRRFRASRAPVISGSLQENGNEYCATLRPNRAAAQAFEAVISAKNRRIAAHDCVGATA